MTVNRLHGYPKVWNLGHRAIANLFDGPVVIQEKVDGSQFTFGVINGQLKMRSRGAEIFPPVTDNLFKTAAETAERLFQEGRLVEGWQYRGEAIWRPKHNTLEYERAPDAGVILFDVDKGLEDRISGPDELRSVAGDLGLEVVPTLYTGEIENLDGLKAHLETVSILGGAKVEGIVIKNYSRWGDDGKMLMGKLVSEAFREKHGKEWKKTNPGKGDVVQQIKDTYRSERRWEKATQHLRERGELTDSPKDIGPLLKEVQQDIQTECRDEIADALFKAFWKDIGRGVAAGLPEWYKERLAQQQFEASDS